MDSIDVELAPGFKFVRTIVGFCTLGVGFLAMSTRNWPRRIDQEGIELRSGKRVAWTDLSGDQRVTAVDQLGRRISGRLDLLFGKTRVAIVPQSIVPGAQVMEVLSGVLGRTAQTG